MSNNTPSPLNRALAWASAAAVLAVVFAAYLQPALAFDLATRVWSCLG